jgi:hypothetical protein
VDEDEVRLDGALAAAEVSAIRDAVCGYLERKAGIVRSERSIWEVATGKGAPVVSFRDSSATAQSRRSWRTARYGRRAMRSSARTDGRSRRLGPRS